MYDFVIERLFGQQSNCAVIPLVGDEPLSLVDGFRRVWELLSAGLFLPGSIGIPDPCEVCMSRGSLDLRLCLCSLQEGDHGVHENLPPHVCDELTRHAQMMLQMLSFGAYREVLAIVSQISCTVLIYHTSICL